MKRKSILREAKRTTENPHAWREEWYYLMREGTLVPGGRSSVDFCFEILLNIQIQMSVRSARNSKYFIRLYQIDFPMVQSPLTNWKL